LLPEAELASFAYDRADGSGYFRCLSGAMVPLEARLLAAAAAWIALQSPRPWRDALSPDEAMKLLGEEARGGRFDADAVAALRSDEGGNAHRLTNNTPRTKPVTLSTRETDVLRHISQGASNKEVARVLDISLSTVRTHVESTFRKLECSTRAAATLKASAMGLL
jgi:DNA-binding CsgD family transcriptional regulator